MPELSIEGGVYCATNEDWETTVVGSKGDEYLVRWEQSAGRDGGSEYDWTCTCKGFEYHPEKPCKHIRQVIAEEKRCCWNWEMEPGSSEEVCPKCGGPVASFRVGV